MNAQELLKVCDVAEPAVCPPCETCDDPTGLSHHTGCPMLAWLKAQRGLKDMGFETSDEGIARARQYAALLEALEKIAHDDTVSYLACPGPTDCDGSHYESCPVQIARAVLPTEVKP